MTTSSRAARPALGVLVLTLVLCILLAVPAVAVGATSRPAAAPSARYDHSLVAINGRAYLFGGMGADGLLGDLWLYDGSWQAIASSGAPSARSRHAAAAAGGRMYLFFGQGEAGQAYNDVWVFDPLTRGWQQRQPQGDWPLARYGHSAVAVGSEILIFGGRVVGGGSDPCVWRYRTLSNAWERGACLEQDAWSNGVMLGQAAVAVNGYMYVYPPDSVFSRLLRYDPVANSWSNQAVLDDDYAPRSLSAVAWRDNRIWLFGGEIPTIGQTPNILEFTIPADGSMASLRPLPCLPAARSRAQAVALTTGSGASSTLTQVLVFGGERGGRPLAEQVLYSIGPAATPSATPTRVPPSPTATATATPTVTPTQTRTPTAIPQSALTHHLFLPLVQAAR